MTQTRLEAHRATSSVWQSLRRSSSTGGGTFALGAGVSQDMLSMWQSRATSGPFQVDNDYATNSPGDWTKIVGERDTLVSSGFTQWRPVTRDKDGNELWNEPTVESTSGAGNYIAGCRRLASAAMVHMISGDTTARNAAANGLYAQLTNGYMDFENTTRWIRTRSSDWQDKLMGPAALMDTLVQAYDYLHIAGDFPLTSTQNTEILTRFYHFADWALSILNDTLTSIYSSASARFDETGVPYVASSNAGAVWVDASGVSGPSAYYSEHRWWNNRRAGGNDAVNRIGWLLTFYEFTGSPGTYTPRTMIDHSKLFARETLKWSVFADGTLTDFERETSTTGPDSRLGYTSHNIGNLGAIASRGSLHGDNDMWTFETTVGTRGSEGAPPGFPGGKSILFAQTAICNYVADLWARYKIGNRGDEDWRLDFRNPRDASSWDGTLHSNMALVYNGYHNDPLVKRVVSRTQANTYWPSSPAGIGKYGPWSGSFGREPALLFMYAEVE